MAASNAPMLLPHGRAWSRLVMALLVASCVLYLVQVNRLATRGYQMETLQQQIEKIRQENRDLESQALQLQSFQHLTSQVNQLEMVPAGSVQYLTELPPVTARVNASVR